MLENFSDLTTYIMIFAEQVETRKLSSCAIQVGSLATNFPFVFRFSLELFCAFLFLIDKLVIETVLNKHPIINFL